MTWRSRWGQLLVGAALAVTAACSDGAHAAVDGERAPDRAAVTTTVAPTSPSPSPSPSTSSSTTSSTSPSTSTTTSTAPPPPPTVTTAAPAPAPPTARPHPPRTVHDQAFVPYATVGPVTLHHPSDHVEAIGFHQSGHDGAQHQIATATAARWFVQEDRDRDTDPQGAADIVVEPDREVRVPVTGTVLRAGTYTLYCDKVDQYAVIEPDARPGWQVKVLHIEGLALAQGQRVEAGVTRLAARARVLPFASTVEEDTAVPAWPHVHVEVVDPRVVDRPTGPGCP